MKHLPLHIGYFEQTYKEFNRAIRTMGYSRGHESMYPSCVREFLFFIENRGITAVRQVQAADIIAYHAYLMERPNQRREGGLSDSMIRHHLFSLRLFFDYLLETGEIKSSVARLPKFAISKYKERNILTTEEVKQLYDACQSKRDKALISIAYGCGLRRSELHKLNTADVQLHQGILLVRDSKNHKSRTVPISDAVLQGLKEYLIYERAQYFQGNQHEQTPAFFINDRGLRMSGSQLNQRLRQLIQSTQNVELIRKEITLHCLRHSIATHLLDNGATIEFVQQFLGHSQIDTAHIYARKRKQRLNIKSIFSNYQTNSNQQQQTKP